MLSGTGRVGNKQVSPEKCSGVLSCSEEQSGKEREVGGGVVSRCEQLVLIVVKID